MLHTNPLKNGMISIFSGAFGHLQNIQIHRQLSNRGLVIPLNLTLDTLLTIRNQIDAGTLAAKAAAAANAMDVILALGR